MAGLIRRRALFLLIAASTILTSGAPVIAQDKRYVPQLSLTNLHPRTVTFHPQDPATMMVLNAQGRIDFFDIADWSRPAKKLEIFSGARAATLSSDGKHLVSVGFEAIRLWEAATGKAIGKPLEGHNGWVESVSFSPDGKSIVTGGTDGTVRLWQVREGSPSGKLLGEHDRRGRSYRVVVRSVAFSHDSRLVASAGDDGVIRFWDPDGGGAIGEPLEANQGPVTCVAFSPDGKRLLSCSSSGLRLWNLETRKLIRVSKEAAHIQVRDAAYNPDGTRIASADSSSVRLWDAETGEQIGAPLAAHSGQVTSVSFSPDGKYIASAADDNAVRLWEVKGIAAVGDVVGEPHDRVKNVMFTGRGYEVLYLDGFDVRILDAKGQTAVTKSPQNTGISAVTIALGPDGKRLVVGGYGNYQLWDLESLMPIGKVTFPQTYEVRAIAYSPDRSLIVSGGSDGAVRLLSAETLSAVGAPLFGHRSSVESVAFFPDGKRIVSGGGDNTVRVWDVEKQVSVGGPLLGHESDVEALAVSPDGNLIVSGGADGTVRLWNARSHNAIGPPIVVDYEIVWSVAFSPDSRYIVFGGGNTLFVDNRDGAMEVWDTEDHTRVGRKIVLENETLWSVAFSPNGKRIVSGGYKVRVWDFQVGVPIGGELRARETIGQRTVVSYNGTRIATEVGHEVKVWNFETGRSVGKPLMLVHQEGRGVGGPSVYGIALSPDGKRVAIGGVDLVQVWEVESGTLIGHFPARFPKHAFRSVAYSPDGRFIVTEEDRGKIRLLNAADANAVWSGPLSAHNGYAQVAFSPDGKLLVTGGEDGMLRLWSDLRRPKSVYSVTPRANLSIEAVAFGVDSAHIASVHEDGMVTLWKFGDGELVPVVSKLACKSKDLYWLIQDVITIDCGDRLVFFDSRLNRVGELFLLKNVGVVAIAKRAGVFALPTRLKDRVVRYIGEANRGGANSISVSELRETLFDERSLWTMPKWVIEASTRFAVDTHTTVRDWVGYGVYPIWVFLVWAVAGLFLLVMWVLFPAKLAWWSMSKGGSPQTSKNIVVATNITNAVLIFTWLGQTRRPLMKWLKQNRHVLEKRCFTDMPQVRERERYLPLGEQDVVLEFRVRIERGERGLVWIHGVGGRGKSALAMFMLGETMNRAKEAPLPVLVDEDWEGSLATQVARQIRDPSWVRGPSEEMVRILGSRGLICPLVDSLSERSMVDAVSRVGNAVSSHEFRHLVVTSREEAPTGNVWQAMTRLVPRELAREDLAKFIRVYVPEAGISEVDVVQKRIESLVDIGDMPSPLFLRFAVEQAALGSLQGLDRLSLVVEYLEALRYGRIDLRRADMERAAGVIAVASVRDRLTPLSLTEEQVRMVLDGAMDEQGFFDEQGKRMLASPEVMDMLVSAGLIVEKTYQVQFSYDPVAEYLAAWRVSTDESGALTALRRRIEKARDTGVGRAYQDVVGVKRDGESGQA